jgi:molybdenum cofactor cytidylyltransferase
VFPATAAGEQRNPVLWPRRFFPKLMALSGREGAKRLLQSLGSESVSIVADDAGTFADIDTIADLEASLDRRHPARFLRRIAGGSRA